MNYCELFILQIVKDILLIVGAATTILFAFLGYGKWKKELKGKAKYELARSSLKALYSFRDGFKGLRNPFTFSGELPPNYKPLNPNEEEEEQYVITNRLKNFNNDYNSLKSLLPEMELEYDQELFDLFHQLFGHVIDYQVKLNEYFLLLGRTNNQEHFKELIVIIKDTGNPNKLTDEFNLTVSMIEEKLKAIIKKY